MNKTHTLIDYEARIKRVISHIHDHLDEDLNDPQTTPAAELMTEICMPLKD